MVKHQQYLSHHHHHVCFMLCAQKIDINMLDFFASLAITKLMIPSSFSPRCVDGVDLFREYIFFYMMTMFSITLSPGIVELEITRNI
jgi:hypothetical protein